MASKSMKELTQNKGEWAEFYVFLKQLGDGRLYAANDKLERDCESYLEVQSVIREEVKGKPTTYRVNPDDRMVSVRAFDEQVLTIPMDQFSKAATQLKSAIDAPGIGTMHAPDAVCKFADKIGVTKPKSPSIKSDSKEFGGKVDIIMELRDGRTGLTEKMGFSIKSQDGGDSTLFNAGKGSALLYQVSNCDDTKMMAFNAFRDSKGHRAVSASLAFLDNEGMSLSFVGCREEKFRKNLLMVRADAIDVLGGLIYVRYLGHESSTDISTIVDSLSKSNLLGIDISPFEPGIYYKKVIKDFLMDSFSGLSASTPWNGEEQVNGGYIVVKPDGEILCYHASDRERFRDYLYRNTYLEQPSTSKFDWCTISKSDDGRYLLPLNFSVRFCRGLR